MNHLTPEVIAAIGLLASISIGILAAWCFHSEGHTPEDDREQIEYLIRCAEEDNARRIRLGRRTWRNFYGLWSN